MSQRPIDLLPDSIRASCLAGIRTGRLIALIGLAVAILVVAATHTRFDLNRARDRFHRAEEHAALVLATDARAKSIHAALSEVRDQIDVHDRIILPLDISALLATLVNQLPPSVSLDRIDVTAHTRRATGGAPGGGSRGSRSQGEADAPPQRVLVGEMTGFAANDDEIAELVSNLERTRPFDAVSLDFSRTRAIRGHAAREFRISFSVPLDVRYQMTDVRDVEPLSKSATTTALGTWESDV